MKKALLLIFVFCFGNLFSQNKTPFQPFSNNALDAKVEKILAKMTQEEKLAQITGITPTILMENGKLSLEKCRKIIPNGI